MSSILRSMRSALFGRAKTAWEPAVPSREAGRFTKGCDPGLVALVKTKVAAIPPNKRVRPTAQRAFFHINLRLKRRENQQSPGGVHNHLVVVKNGPPLPSQEESYRIYLRDRRASSSRRRNNHCARSRNDLSRSRLTLSRLTTYSRGILCSCKSSTPSRHIRPRSAQRCFQEHMRSFSVRTRRGDIVRRSVQRKYMIVYGLQCMHCHMLLTDEIEFAKSIDGSAGQRMYDHYRIDLSQVWNRNGSMAGKPQIVEITRGC
jgi:hypothetical protein